MRVGLVYDLRDDYRALGFAEEDTAEFDFVATIDGRFLEVNNALVHMLGYPSETALRSVSARVPFQNPESFDMLARRALQGERLQGEEVEWHSFDGQRVSRPSLST